MAEDVSSEAPIYQNVGQPNNQQSNERWSVYGESHYLAKGVYSKEPWDPSTRIKGISSYPPETDITLEAFLNHYEKFLPWISNTAVDERNQGHVTLLVHTVFPHLETKIAKSGRTADILDIILKLSCVKQCPVVTRYALNMILETLTKTSYDSGGMFNDFLLKCESCLRNTLVEVTIFDYENAEDQGLRVFVYSRSLMMLYANIVQGTIPLGTMNTNFEALLVRLHDLEEQIFFVEKDKPRYAIRCIKETIARLSKFQRGRKDSKKSFYTFLKWLREYNSKVEENRNERNESVKSFLSQIKTSKKGWFDFHATVFCLASQIHKKPQNREILKSLVEQYIKQHSDCCSKWTSEGEWQTGLVLGSVLEDIINYNHDKDTRKHACLCLIKCFKDVTKRNSLEKLWLQESLQRSLFGPNTDLRQVILVHLELGGKDTRKSGANRDNMDEHIPIIHTMDYLVHKYKKQLLPSSQEFRMRNNLKGYFAASFRGEKAIVKILEAIKDDLAREERKGVSKIRQQLLVEAYTLRRLNSKPHPNILRVFAYDTSAQPYHLITELVSEGSLLQFLHSLRSRPEHMPVPSVLLQMMFGVLDAVIYLIEQHLVHLALMAANVLVSHDNVCKLTGFQFVREMKQQVSDNYEYVSVHDETATRHAAPECLEKGCFSEKSVSWAVGIMLFEMHTYGVSPYNQYSNDQADQIRSHVISRGKLRMEDCIRIEICEVIEECLSYEKENRPSLEQLKMELERVHNQIIEEEKDWPAANYPALTNVDLAQIKDSMRSRSALEELDKEKNLGNFGSETTSPDRPIIRSFEGDKVIRELVLKTTEEDLEKLKYLKHRNVVNVIALSDHDNKSIALVTEYSGLGNLLEATLAKTYRPEQLVTFAAQIAQGMCYLHDNNMIHGDLRAENTMVFPNIKVKISRLGRSKAVGARYDIKCRMPEDAVRWSPPEVIKDGIYSHSSDVYSYGLTCFELFEAVGAAGGCKPDDIKPFPTIEDNKILDHLQANKRPTRPQNMPIWLYIVVKQCLLHKPSERPPFVLIDDALTSSKPYESCFLSHWLNKHENEADNVDVNVTQPIGASHVIPKQHHKTFEELHRFVAVEVFLDHTYLYEPGYKDYGQTEDPYDPYDPYEIYEEIPAQNLEAAIGQKPLSEQPRSLQPPTFPPPPPPPSQSENIPIQESEEAALVRTKSEMALYSPSSPLTHTKTSRFSFPDYEASDPPYENVKRIDESEKSSCAWPSLPASPFRNQQNIDENRSTDVSPCSDGPCNASDVSPYMMIEILPGVSDNVQDVPVMDDEERGPVECSLQYPMHQLENHEREHTSIASNDPGATESSWHSLTPQNGQQDGSSSTQPQSLASNNPDATESSWHSLPPNNGQQDGSSSCQPPSVAGSNLGATECSWHSLTQQNDHQDGSILSEPLGSSTSRLPNRPVPLPRTKLRQDSPAQK